MSSNVGYKDDKEYVCPKEQETDDTKHKPGYHIVDWEEECSQFTPGAHWHYGGDSYHYHFKIWLPIALRWDNVSDWMDRHENKIEGLLVKGVDVNE